MAKHSVFFNLFTACTFLYLKSKILDIIEVNLRGTIVVNDC